MTLQKLKTTFVITAMALLLVGGAVLCIAADKTGKPAASAPVVRTFEPMAGEWEGTYETRSADQPRARQQMVAVTIRTFEQGRSCKIDMSVLDRNERPTATFHFSHALNVPGNRILTTNDPSMGGAVLDGLVTEAAHDLTTGNWRAAFRATQIGNTNFTECRWTRLGEDLTISREDVINGPIVSTHLMSDLKLRRRSNKPRGAYDALPRGTQTFDGVVFVIQKPINIIGARAGQARGSAFASVSDSTIHGRGRHIHVLHTGDHGSSKTGEFIWRLVLHYADGETERFDFAYDIHLRNFWRRASDGPPTPSDPNTSLAWVGTSVESDRTGAELVVSRTTLKNPRPNVEVIGAEFVSLLGESSAYVLAVTVSDDGPKPTDQNRSSATNAVPLTLTFENESGQPQVDTTLDCKFECDGYTVRLAPYRTDKNGRITLDVPVETVHAIQYRARHPSGKIESGQVKVSPTDRKLPPQILRFSD